jgi:hypothetical protein
MDFSLGARESEVAILAQTRNKVKDKAANGIAWGDSETGKALGNRHSIQTFHRSSATIAFDESNRLELGPNSLIVLKSFDREGDGSDRRASLIMMGGFLRGQLAGSDADSLQVEVETKFGTARIRSADKTGKAAVFQVKVNEDKSSTISVEEGVAEITTEGGAVQVSSERMVTLSKNVKPTVLDFPEAPSLLSPERGAAHSYRSQPPKIEFRWSRRPDADGYTFRLARDPDFEQIVHETQLEATEFAFGNLDEGSYFWHVSSTRAGAEGDPSESGQFELVQDLDPPRIRIAWPEGTVRTKTFVLSGEAEPDSQVFIANDRVPVSESGEFSYVIALERGMNIVVVEALDQVGNSTYQSKTLNAQY